MAIRRLRFFGPDAKDAIPFLKNLLDDKEDLILAIAG